MRGSGLVHEHHLVRVLRHLAACSLVQVPSRLRLA